MQHTTMKYHFLSTAVIICQGTEEFWEGNGVLVFSHIRSEGSTGIETVFLDSGFWKCP